MKPGNSNTKRMLTAIGRAILTVEERNTFFGLRGYTASIETALLAANRNIRALDESLAHERSSGLTAINNISSRLNALQHRVHELAREKAAALDALQDHQLSAGNEMGMMYEHILDLESNVERLSAQLKDAREEYSQDKAQAADEILKLTQSATNLRKEIETLMSELAETRAENGALKKEVQDSTSRRDELAKDCAALRKELTVEKNKTAEALGAHPVSVARDRYAPGLRLNNSDASRIERVIKDALEEAGKNNSPASTSNEESLFAGKKKKRRIGKGPR